MKKTFLFFSLLLACISIEAQEFTVGSYNIRYANTADSLNGNAWSHRCPVITQLIKYNDFDIIGTQEVLHRQLGNLLEALPEYTYVGVGRDDGKTEGEYAPIFFKKDKFEVLQSGHFWMSEETTYPNKGWDAVLPRICTWVQLKDKESNLNLWHFNLHMDHVGVKARRESAKLVLSRIKEMCGNEPVILTGDFNVDQTHQSYSVFANSGILTDSYEVADVSYALNGTFNNFNPNIKTDSRIDHVFVSPSFSVKRYGVLTDTYRERVIRGEQIEGGDFPTEVKLYEYICRLPSDHFPVKVKLIYKK